MMKQVKEQTMTYADDKMQTFVALLEEYTGSDGVHETAIPSLITFRASSTQAKIPMVYEPAVVIVGQGKKYGYLGNQTYTYSASHYLALFLTMPLEVEIAEASVDKPALMAGIKIDLNKIATMLLKMDQVKQQPSLIETQTVSSIFSDVLDDDLLDPAIRLLQTLDNSTDRLMLSDLIIEEIYYRILCHDQTGALQRLLGQQGQIQQIAKAVTYIHDHIEQAVSVEELASLVGMSVPTFYRSFKTVMHLSPLQYAKSIKLFKAHMMIQGGKRVSEAGYMVGYNSPSQFSREFKRHFGVSPSAITINFQPPTIQ
ncbi:MAG: AraC family transcriptional regulator [Chloroflexota bacterium]